MAEEKKEEKIEQQVPQKPAEEAAPKTPEVKPEAAPAPSEGQADAPAAAASTPAAEKKEPAKPTRERPSNCAGCNKSIKKKRWYYRNGKFYCTQRCWKTAAKKKDAAAPAPETKT